MAGDEVVSEDSELEGISGDESSFARLYGRGFMSSLIMAESGQRKSKSGRWEEHPDKGDGPDAADHA